LPPERQAIAFRILNKTQARDVFEYLPSEVQETLIESLHATQVRQVVEEMRPDARAELFDELPAKVVRRLLDQLSAEERHATATILGYTEGTAGRVMTTEYVRLREGLTVGEALSKIRLTDHDKETIYYAYVTDDSRKLVSVISLRQLLFSIPTVLVRDIAGGRVLKARTDMPQEEVAQLMKRYDLLALPVVDREDRLVGIVTIDDVVDILEEEATEDIQKLAGVSGGDEAALSHPSVTIRKRLPWLLGNIGLYVGAASAIAPFQNVISLVPVLAVVMPILSNASGNVGIQALSVTVRGLGVGEVTPKDTMRILHKEIMAGLGTAVALGLALGILSLIWSPPNERWVALVAGSVMAVNVLLAATIGTLLPMGLKRMRLDPALISGPLLTTTLDAVGFLTFLSLISIALKIFGQNA
jgi:magnesium transporter